MAKSRIEAIEKAACVKIEMACLEAQTQVVSHGLTSEAARAFFEAMPNVEVLMPPVEFKAIETMLHARNAEERARQEYRYHSLGADDC